MSSPFRRRKSSLWAMEGYKPKVRRMFGGGEIKETVISEWKTCQKMSNFDKCSSNEAEKNGEKQEEVTKRQRLTSWAPGHHTLLTHIIGQQEDTFGQHKKNQKFYLYDFCIHFNFGQNKNSHLYGFHIHFIFQKGKPIFVNP